MPRRAQQLFTVIADYRGGTYISQVRAHDVVGALRVWVRELDPAPIAGFGETRKRELIASVEEDIRSENFPTPIQDVQNMWCATGSCGGGFMLIDLIKTAPSVSRPRAGWADAFRKARKRSPKRGILTDSPPRRAR